MINMLGQMVLENKYTEAVAKTPLNIDISDLPTGIYIYHITTESGKVVEGKVVKM